MADTTEDKLAGARLVVTVLREQIEIERRRSDRYRDVLVRISLDMAEDHACALADAALNEVIR